MHGLVVSPRTFAAQQCTTPKSFSDSALQLRRESVPLLLYLLLGTSLASKLLLNVQRNRLGTGKERIRQMTCKRVEIFTKFFTLQRCFFMKLNFAPPAQHVDHSFCFQKSFEPFLTSLPMALLCYKTYWFPNCSKEKLQAIQSCINRAHRGRGWLSHSYFFLPLHPSSERRLG